MAKLALERLIPVAHADAPERTGGVRRLPVHALRALIDALPEPIYVKDRGHRWVLVNTAYCEYIERNAADLLGKTERDFLSAQEAGAIWKSDEAVFATGQSVANAEIAVGSDEGLRFLQTQKSLLRDDKGKELLLGIVREVEDRRVEDLDTPLGENQLPPRRRRLDGVATSQVRYPFSDPLTQLPNRRSFMNLLDSAITG